MVAKKKTPAKKTTGKVTRKGIKAGAPKLAKKTTAKKRTAGKTTKKTG